MIAETVYALCAALSGLCAALLWRMWAKTKLRLLFWSVLGFAGLAANNALLFIDKILLPDTDLTSVRLITAIVALAALCFGLIWDVER